MSYPQQPTPPPATPNPKRLSTPVIVLFSVLGILGAFMIYGIVANLLGTEDQTTPSPQAATATTTHAPATPAPSPAAIEGVPPIPAAAARAAYIADLKTIDPAIVGDKDERTLISRGRDQCTSVWEHPNDQARLVSLTNQRFTAPSHPEGFGEKKAALILAAVRKHICPTY